MKLSSIHFIFRHDKQPPPVQAMPNYFKYLQTQFDPAGLESSIWCICLQKWNINHDSLYSPDSYVKQYPSWDSYCRMLKRSSLLSVIYADDIHWAYLLCLSCNLPTSLCWPLVCQHKHNSDDMHPPPLNAPAQLWEGFTINSTKDRRGEHIYKNKNESRKKTTAHTQTFTNQRYKTTRRMKGKRAPNTDFRGLKKKIRKISLHKGHLYWF